MWANHSGLQMGTRRNLPLVGMLTLPVWCSAATFTAGLAPQVRLRPGGRPATAGG